MSRVKWTCQTTQRPTDPILSEADSS